MCGSFVFYFWFGVVLLCIFALLVAVLRRFQHRTRGQCHEHSPQLCNVRLTSCRLQVLDKRGGFNGSTQHSSRTRLALKTKAKSLARLDQPEHYPG